MGKIKNWLLSAKQNLDVVGSSSDRKIWMAMAQALVSIAEDVDELVGMVRESREDVYCSHCGGTIDRGKEVKQ